jgi:XTP/dITP diphosphohydrolase
MVQVAFATRNPGKLKELRELVKSAGLAIEWVGLDAHPEIPEVVEDQDTFAGNARKKATEVAARLQMPALADDSGLCVDALHGAPGVYSARYAPGTDADRVHKLLHAIEAVPEEGRGAHFTCVLCLAFPDGRVVELEGQCEGRIARAPVGQGGFGYDPVFLVGGGRSMAQLSADEKHAVSHRGNALRAMLPHLEALARTK